MCFLSLQARSNCTLASRRVTSPDGPTVLADRRPAMLAGGLAILLAAGVALWVALDQRAPSVPPYAGTEKQQG